ncbi:MAG: membrane-bound lytic murein transglycosylase MltF [Proteobacteria bacterium]|nr:membrane-bound lytic murein transglycosylase MltF [Pseudomonadota bacterium]HQR03766.1 membrane-bound lytic murein transglycosylase MltF [Rhodocyclaceae bacterium]
MPGHPARLAVLLCLLFLAACQRLASPESSGELVVAIRAGPSSYEVDDKGGSSGFERDLVQAFAQSLGYRVRFVVANDQAELYELLDEGHVHFAASAWEHDVPHIRYTSPIRESDPVVVSRGDDLTLGEDPSVLTGHTVGAMIASPQLEALRKLAGEPPRFSLQPHAGAEYDLLQAVADNKLDFASTDRLQYRLALQFLPDLQVAFTLPGRIRFGWAFREGDDKLRMQADRFIADIRRGGLLARLQDRYFGHIDRIKPEGITELLDDIQTLLPRFRKFFQDAQEITGLDWRLLAAVAYQESKWDPLATSPTGVRGIMMLTEDTADHLHVSNRLDPRQSILAGAKYLADLRNLLPLTVKEPDRTWFALAAYNLGMGHFNGGRAIAVGLKRDADSWFEMKKVLPLMARPEYYARLKSGRARGGEAVIMVENIRTYFSIISRFTPPWRPDYQLVRSTPSSPHGLRQKHGKPPKLGGIS